MTGAELPSLALIRPTLTGWEETQLSLELFTLIVSLAVKQFLVTFLLLMTGVELLF